MISKWRNLCCKPQTLFDDILNLVFGKIYQSIIDPEVNNNIWDIHPNKEKKNKEAMPDNELGNE